MQVVYVDEDNHLVFQVSYCMSKINAAMWMCRDDDKEVDGDNQQYWLSRMTEVDGGFSLVTEDDELYIFLK